MTRRADGEAERAWRERPWERARPGYLPFR